MTPSDTVNLANPDIYWIKPALKFKLVADRFMCCFGAFICDVDLFVAGRKCFLPIVNSEYIGILINLFSVASKKKNWCYE